MFDVGALVFRIQTVGAQVFQRDQADAKQALEKTGKAATEAGQKLDENGNATDRAGKKSRDAKKPLEEQAKATEDVGNKSRKSSQDQDTQAASTERQIESAKKLSAALLVGGVAISAMVGLSIAKYTEFDKAMSQTSAATMATADEQKALGEAALDAGADTAYSASEAAAAEEELAKAGQSVADIVGGSLNGALGLAAAGQLGVARSAEVMATTLTQFQLPAKDAARVADVLAAGAGKAQGSVEDMGLAMSYVGPLANSFGWSLEETAGTIAYFSSQGIIGEKAGTALRGVLAALQAPSVAAANVMQEYGIQVYDAQGKMLGAAGIAEQFRTKLGGLTDQERQAALGRIFGNESLLGATLLYEGGADAVNKWTGEVTDAGYAAEQAAMRQDNLAGDIEKLGGSFDTALIRTGSGANEVLRQIVQSTTALIDMFGEAPAPIHTTVLVLGTAVAAMLLFSGAAVAGRAKIIELKTALDSTNSSFTRTALVGAGAGLALTGIIAVLGILVAKQAEMNAGAAELADTLDEETGALTESTRAAIAKKLADTGAFNAAREAGIGQDELTDALYRGGSAYEAVMRKLRDAHDASGGWNATIGNGINAVKDMRVQLDDARVRHDDLKAATEGSTEATVASTSATLTASDAYVESAASVEQMQSNLSDLIDTIMAANEANLDAREANRRYIDALADFDSALVENGLTLDLNTEAGRANEEKLDAIAEAAMNTAKATTEAGGGYDQYRASLEGSRQALLDRIAGLGITGDKAGELADQILRIPSESEWSLIADTTVAQQRADAFRATLDRITGRRTVTLDLIRNVGYPISPQAAAGLPQADGGVLTFYANGGTEHHVAQMARAGSYRVWAEPETEGESYIPHAVSKRARSEQIMVETAGKLGGVYIPAAAVPYANGSPLGSGASASVASIDGARITGRLAIDADGFANLIDARIHVARSETAVGLSSGESSR